LREEEEVVVVKMVMILGTAIVVLVAAKVLVVAEGGEGISPWKSLVPEMPVTAETSSRPPALQ
jgi:hypothetical protein